MQYSLVQILALALVFAATQAFTVRPAVSRPAVRMFSEPESDEEGGLDLDLGEMFEMFDAADKEESFDDALKKVKGDDN
jgi:hypothetical protein